MEWFYIHDSQQVGPVSKDDLQNLLQGGMLALDTPVWTAGMDDWTPAGSATGLQLPAAQTVQTKTVARLTIALLVAAAVTDALAVLLGVRQLDLLSTLERGVNISQSALELHDTLYGGVGLLQVALYLTTAIPFILWFHRVHKILPSLGAQDLKYSPGWAVGGWFIPILHVIRPYQVAREIWVESARHTTERAESDLQPSYGPVALWWFLFLAMNFLGTGSARSMNSAEGLAEITEATALVLAADATSMLCAGAAVWVVGRIQQMQRKAMPVPMINPKDFGYRTAGGRPVGGFDYTPYWGAAFECVCGEQHVLSPDLAIVRELPPVRFVAVCPDGEHCVCVKAKGLFRFKELVTQFGTYVPGGLDEETGLLMMSGILGKRSGRKWTPQEAQGYMEKVEVFRETLAQAERNKSAPDDASEPQESSAEQAIRQIASQIEPLQGLDRKFSARMLKAAWEIIDNFHEVPTDFAERFAAADLGACVSVYKILLGHLFFTMFAKDREAQASLARLLTDITDNDLEKTDQLWSSFRDSIASGGDEDLRIATARIAWRKICESTGADSSAEPVALLCFVAPWDAAVEELNPEFS